MVDDEPWFVGKDVATALEYSNPSNAVVTHVDDEDKTDGVTIRDSIGREQAPVLINESGLYSLVLSSKLPTAKKFKHWITSEVLPAIRKHGGYLTPEKVEEVLLNPDFLIRLAAELKTEREARAQAEKQIQQDKPKVLFADAVSDSNSTILIGDLAKILKGNGVQTGQKRLFAWLREHGYLIQQKGTSYNMPTQRAMDMGLFRVKEGSYINGSGVNVTTRTVKVTGKGQQYFINKFLRGETA